MMIYSSTSQLPDLPKVVTGYQIRATHIDTTKIDVALQQADDANATLALDWEADDAFARLDPTDPTFDPKAIKEAHAILDYCEQKNAGVKVGFYGVLPPLHGEYNSIRIDWPNYRKQAGTLSHGPRSLVDRVDRLYPSLYLPRTWREDWPKFKGNAELVANRVAETSRDWQKICQPFVRPDGFTDPAHWAEWVNIVVDMFGGCVVWENIKQDPAYWEAIL